MNQASSVQTQMGRWLIRVGYLTLGSIWAVKVSSQLTKIQAKTGWPIGLAHIPSYKSNYYLDKEFLGF